MRTPQKKLVALLLLWAAVLVFQVVWMSEPARLSRAEARVLEEQVARGAQLYAENCVICHGPAGEGVIGPPVNRPEWREDLTEIEREQVSAMLTSVVALGRGGTDSTHWEISGGPGNWTITSYTRMPTWGREHGGPLNEQQVEDLVALMMHFDWSTAKVAQMIAPHIPQANMTSFENLPEAQGVSDAVNERGRQLVAESCLVCHVVGDYGRPYGPNLTDVGNWTTPEFLYDWLTDTENLVPRMPTIWMGNGERKTTPEDVPVDWTGIHKTVMPNPVRDLGLSEEDVEILVEYLSGLRGN